MIVMGHLTRAGMNKAAETVSIEILPARAESARV